MKKTLLIATIAVFIFSGCNKDDADNKPEVPFLTNLSGGLGVVQFSWKTVTGATSYNIYRSSSEKGTFNRIGSASGLPTDYNINGFNFKRQYVDQNPLSGDNSYRVTAVNSDGESAPSNILTIKVN